MKPQPKIDSVQLSVEQFLPAIEACQKEGYRLVQIMASLIEPKNEGDAPAYFDMIYSFDKDLSIKNLRLHVAKDTVVPSITKSYLAAYLYENEIREHFGIDIQGIAVDFKGTLYKTAIKHPFAVGRKS